MEISEKKDLVIDFIKLGMSFEKACLSAGLTEEEEDILCEDNEFQRELKIEDACLEATLLQRHDVASKLAEKKGSTHAIEWKLSKLNPSRFGNKEGSGEGSFTGKLVLNMVRGKSEED